MLLRSAGDWRRMAGNDPGSAKCSERSAGSEKSIRTVAEGGKALIEEAVRTKQPDLDAGRAFYRPRRPREIPLYRVLDRNFDEFKTTYEDHFERRYGPCVLARSSTGKYSAVFV